MTRKADIPSVFQYLDYRNFLRDWISKVPEKPRGQLTRIAEHSGIHKTTLSQIFAGSKDLSLEQAQAVGEYFGLATAEIGHLVLLVNLARAGTAALRETFRKEVETRRRAHSQLVNRVSKSRVLTSEERATYYSHWIYA